jgi:VIT1/CCC1 family predicted Fe2+/Mn2+ transporter
MASSQTASLIIGVAAAAATQHDVMIAGVAGLVAAAMSMAAGEYVSISSQSDTEHADLARERKELSKNTEFERDELAEAWCRSEPCAESCPTANGERCLTRPRAR